MQSSLQYYPAIGTVPFSSFLLCLYKPQLLSSSQEFKNKKVKIKLGKRLKEVTAYLDTDRGGGRDSQGRESNKWRETETWSERTRRLSEGQGHGIGRRSGQLGIHSLSLEALEDCGLGLRCYARPQAPVGPPWPGEMEQSHGGSVAFGRWAC